MEHSHENKFLWRDLHHPHENNYFHESVFANLTKKTSHEISSSGSVSGYQPCYNLVDLTEKANPCLQNEEHKQELERSNSIEVTNCRSNIKHSKLGFDNR